MAEMKRKIVSIVLILFIVVIGIIYLIRPVEKFNDIDSDKVSLKEILSEKLLDSITGMIFDTKENFQFDFTEQDINNIIAENTDKLKSKKISGLHCIIHNSETDFYFDTSVISFLPTQLILKTNIDVVDNEIKINVKRASIGRIPVSKEFVLKLLQNRMEDLEIDSTSSSITIPTSLPGPVSINDFEVSDSIKFKISISIKSAKDMVELIEYFGNKVMK